MSRVNRVGSWVLSLGILVALIGSDWVLPSVLKILNQNGSLSAYAFDPSQKGLQNPSFYYPLWWDGDEMGAGSSAKINGPFSTRSGRPGVVALETDNPSVVIAPPNSLKEPNPIGETFAFGFYVDDFGRYNAMNYRTLILFVNTQTPGDVRHGVFIRHSGGGFHYTSQTGKSNLARIVGGNYYHITVVQSLQDKLTKIYINGKLASTAQTNNRVLEPINRIFIGPALGGKSVEFMANHLGYWDHTLQEAEVAELYDAVSSISTRQREITFTFYVFGMLLLVLLNLRFLKFALGWIKAYAGSA